MLSDPVDLSPQSWDLAHGIAMTLAKEEVDVNELSKCFAYLRSVVHLPDAGSRFFRFTGELVRETGLHRSNETPRYYRLIDQTCKKYLQSADPGLGRPPGPLLQRWGSADRRDPVPSRSQWRSSDPFPRRRGQAPARGTAAQRAT